MSSSFKKEIGQVNKAIAECIALIAKVRERKGLESNDETRLKRLANVLKNHIINREEFGLAVLAARRRRKMTQREACDKMGVSRQALSEIERGRGVPNSKTEKELQKLFPEVFE